MNFNSLVWYSSLAIGDEKNSYVANFLKRSCEIINEEINRDIKEVKDLILKQEFSLMTIMDRVQYRLNKKEYGK